jgi:hypothetical protein
MTIIRARSDRRTAKVRRISVGKRKEELTLLREEEHCGNVNRLRL